MWWLDSPPSTRRMSALRRSHSPRTTAHLVPYLSPPGGHSDLWLPGGLPLVDVYSTVATNPWDTVCKSTPSRSQHSTLFVTCGRENICGGSHSLTDLRWIPVQTDSRSPLRGFVHDCNERWFAEIDVGGLQRRAFHYATLTAMTDPCDFYYCESGDRSTWSASLPESRPLDCQGANTTIGSKCSRLTAIWIRSPPERVNRPARYSSGKLMSPIPSYAR